MNDDLPGWAKVIAALSVIPAGIFSTYIGVTLAAGGELPIVGEIDGSLALAVLWFVVAEWLVIGLPLLIVLCIALWPFVAFQRWLERRREDRDYLVVEDP